MSDAPARAITVKQPWASAIAGGEKRVENRTRPDPWRSAIGQTLYLHAGKGWDDTAYQHPAMLDLWQRDIARFLITYMFPQTYPRGVLLATARLTDVHTCDGNCSPWAEPGQWHLVLDDITRLPEPVPAKGALGLWRVP